MEAPKIQTGTGTTAYITQANAALIACRIPTQSFLALTGQLYRRPIYIFSRIERLRLLAIKQFFQHSEEFIDTCYRTVPPGCQNPNMVFPDSDPAYHLSKECPFLHSDYQNIRIPPQIQVRGIQACNEFRAWFLENKNLYESRSDLFMVRLCARFDIRITELNWVEFINTGTTKMVNEDLDEIDRQITRLLCDAGAFYKASDKNHSILKQYQHYTNLGYREDPLVANRTGWPDAEVKAFLRAYNERYKLPLKKLLVTYFRVRYNPELEFTGHLMERLGMKLCNHCDRKPTTKGNINDHAR